MSQKKHTVPHNKDQGDRSSGSCRDRNGRGGHAVFRGEHSLKPKPSQQAARKESRTSVKFTPEALRAKETFRGDGYMQRQTSESVGLPPLSPDMLLPELLVPCGSEEAVYAAVGGGADAVYCGGRILNARMNAKNFDDEAMRRAISYCHMNGVKLYVTMNTLVYDRDSARRPSMLNFFILPEQTGLIVADTGLCMLLREYLPDMELHASTQLSAHNLASAKQLAALGFTRIVPARELSLKVYILFAKGFSR